MLAPFERKGNENPYTIHSDLQECMQNLVGIIRVEAELKQALEKIAEAQAARSKRAASKATASTIPAGTWPWICTRC